ncbi:MAG: hypothetical protein KJ579_08045 [Verrucomicrobia bacterium]|nr:hypothetical protein [Verrucomicrobiota bacterium]
MTPRTAWIAAGIAVACLAQGAEGPRTFHVDDASGDDARAGTAPASAWRTLERVKLADLRPGDRVLFRRGGTWRGQLVPRSGAADAAIVYAAYGDGPKPRLLGSVALNRPEDWESAGPGLWRTAPVRYATAGTPVKLPAARWSLHREAGAKAVQSPHPLSIVCTTPGAAYNHLQLSAVGVPVSVGRQYRLSFRARATGAVQPFSMALMSKDRPWTARATQGTVAVEPGTNWTACARVFRVKIDDPAARVTFFLGSLMAPGSTLELADVEFVEVRPDRDALLDVDVGNIIFDDGAATGIKKWSADALTAENDYVYDAPTQSVLLRCPSNPARAHRSIELALNRHIVNQGKCSFVTYEDLSLAYGAAHGIGGASTRGITVRRCDIVFIGGGHQFTRPGGKPVRFGNGIEFWSNARDCLVEDCRIGEIYDAALTNQGSGTNRQENLVYRRNVIWNAEYSFEYWNRDAASVTRNIVFEHNTCVDAGAGWGHAQRPDRNGRHLMFYSNPAQTSEFAIRGNIFARSVDSLVRLHGRDWTPALAMDRNLWFQPGGEGLLWGTNRVAAADTAAFLRARGFDIHSVFADPQFLDAAARDYRPAPGSPASAFGAAAR